MSSFGRDALNRFCPSEGQVQLVLLGVVWYDISNRDLEVTFMEFIKKARVRIEHWITHNDHHQEEYEAFANQLEEAGKEESARYVREMMALTSKSSECLRKALEALEREYPI